MGCHKRGRSSQEGTCQFIFQAHPMAIKITKLMIYINNQFLDFFTDVVLMDDDEVK